MGSKAKVFFQKGDASIGLILGLLLISAALPVSLRLVQQQQEIRREAVGECRGINYYLPSNIPPNQTICVSMDRRGASNCFGNWDNAWLLHNGNAVGVGLGKCDGSDQSQGYHAHINTGPAGSNHNLRLTFNNQSCHCNLTSFRTSEITEVVSPTCRFTSVPQTVQVGESATFIVSASGGSNNLTQIQLHKRVDDQWVAIGRCDNTGTCTKTTTFSKPGEYWVVCNAFNDYQPTSTKYSQCSGNPFGPFDDWADCGNDSRKRITVVEGLVPTPTPTTAPPIGQPTPTPTIQPGVPTSTPTPTLYLPPPPPLKSEVIFPCDETCYFTGYNPLTDSNLMDCGVGKACYNGKCRNRYCVSKRDCICDEETELPTPNACRCLTEVDNWCLWKNYYGEDCPCTHECESSSWLAGPPEIPSIKKILEKGLVLIWRDARRYIDLFFDIPLSEVPSGLKKPGTNEPAPMCRGIVYISLERNKYCTFDHTCFDKKSDLIDYVKGSFSSVWSRGHGCMDILSHDVYPENAADLQNMISSQQVNDAIKRYTPVSIPTLYYITKDNLVCGKAYNSLGEDITQACAWRMEFPSGRRLVHLDKPPSIYARRYHPNGAYCMIWQPNYTFHLAAICAGGKVQSGPIPPRGGEIHPTEFTPTPESSIPSPTVEPSADCPRKSEGDANCDGVINVLDYSIWRQEKYDRGADTIQGDWQADFNGDGYVDEEDLKILLENWN